jgi:hypothetical protein
MVTAPVATGVAVMKDNGITVVLVSSILFIEFEAISEGDLISSVILLKLFLFFLIN